MIVAFDDVIGGNTTIKKYNTKLDQKLAIWKPQRCQVVPGWYSLWIDGNNLVEKYNWLQSGNVQSGWMFNNRNIKLGGIWWSV